MSILVHIDEWMLQSPDVYDMTYQEWLDKALLGHNYEVKLGFFCVHDEKDFI